jgi:hypothetical protein
MSETIDLEAARSAIEKAWNDISSSSTPPAKMQQAIESVMSASDITYKYMLVTGYLAKYIHPRVHARALQTGSSLNGAYDARSLCHKVVVGFEKPKGNLFGLSNEPFVNKPARHPEHEGDNPQLRNRAIAQRLHTALELAQAGSRDEVYKGLVHILRLGSKHAANETQVKVTTRVNLKDVTSFVEQFLQEADGGARLVAVWGAFTWLLAEKATIKVNSPNAADLYGKTAGDVEVYQDKALVSASECKQRPMNLDDVEHGIGKAVKKGVPEYIFVISAGLVASQEASIMASIRKNSTRVDLSLVDIRKEAQFLAAMLNPVRRAKFGIVVVELLREMRKFESANAAAELWNTVTEKG